MLAWCWVAPCRASAWMEQGDAGDLPATAQAVWGPGTLTAIEGVLQSVNDQDLYRVRIDDPGAFSANLNNSGTHLTGDQDTQLFLFNRSGVAIVMNDDDPLDAATRKSRIPLGAFSGPPGIYLVGVGVFNNDPYAGNDPLFPDEPSDDVLSPNFSGRLDGWGFDPVTSLGPYRLELTGASFVGPSNPVERHLACYAVDHKRKNIPVTLVNQFGASAANLVNIERLCNPADKNNEDPGAPESPVHYVGYTPRRTSGRLPRIRSLQVKNQFGRFVVRVLRPIRLLVPSTKSLTDPAPPLDSATGALLDHFECYRVSGAPAVGPVSVRDQFGNGELVLLKGAQLCVPVDKNGEGILDSDAKLLCYRARQASGTLHGPSAPLFVNNQFGPDTFVARCVHELCVPTSASAAFLDGAAAF